MHSFVARKKTDNSQNYKGDCKTRTETSSKETKRNETQHKRNKIKQKRNTTEKKRNQKNNQ